MVGMMGQFLQVSRKGLSLTSGVVLAQSLMDDDINNLIGTDAARTAFFAGTAPSPLSGICALGAQSYTMF